MQKRVPVPNGDDEKWGSMLNAHLAQTKNAIDGSFNSFTEFSSRPEPSAFTAGKDDAGKTYLYTQTGNWHVLSWDGTKLFWEVQNKSFIDVKDYGAVGDGVTNDTKAIQYCLTNFTKIYFSTGIYATESLQLPGNRTLLGDGGILSELRNITKFENHYINADKEINITIDSMFLNGNKDNRLPNNKIAKEGSTFQFSNTDIVNEPRENNILIKNCIISGNGFNNLGSINTHNILIDGCRFIHGRDSGIAATQGCSNWNVVNCSFDDTMLFPISFSNNGVPSNTYEKVDQVRNIIIANNHIKVGENVDMSGKKISGIGIELDGSKHVVISNNIITITEKGAYGIRLLPSGSKPNEFDCSDVNIVGNTIINQSAGNVSGIEVYNNTTDDRPKYIKISNNTILNEVISNLVGIYCLNMNKVIIENNIIRSTIKNDTDSPSFKTGITLDAGNATNIDISGNDISGGAWVGIQCGDTTIFPTSQKVSLSNNKIYNNKNNLGFGVGWEFDMNNNVAPSPNYLTPTAIHGDFRFYTSAPANGTWKLNEIVYNKYPAGNPYIGWICVQEGTPVIWKGFGLIQE